VSNVRDVLNQVLVVPINGVIHHIWEPVLVVDDDTEQLKELYSDGQQESLITILCYLLQFILHQLEQLYHFIVQMLVVEYIREPAILNAEVDCLN
jgi:hypothetical protein